MARTRPFHLAIIVCDASPADNLPELTYEVINRALLARALPLLRNRKRPTENPDNAPDIDIELVEAENYDDAHYLASPDNSRIVVKTSVWLVQKERKLPNLADVDALWLTGSRFNSYDDHPWILDLLDLLRPALDPASPVRLIGLCFGHQLIARALGVSVGQNPRGWEVSVVAQELTDQGKQLFPIGSNSGQSRDTIRLQQSHLDHVPILPPNAILLAKTDRCLIHSYVIPDKVLTVQGHPEYIPEISAQMLEAKIARGAINSRMYLEARDRVSIEADGEAVAADLLYFALGGWLKEGEK